MNKYIIREWIVGSVYLDCTLGTISVYIPLYKMHKPNVFRNRHCVFEALVLQILMIGNISSSTLIRVTVE